MEQTEGQGTHTTSSVKMLWDTKSVLAEQEDIDRWVAGNIIQLADDGCTIPFIARYRKEKTNNMDVDKLRQVIHSYDQLKTVQTKATYVIKQIDKAGKMNNLLNETIRSSKSIEELEHVYAPYKTGSKSTLAERARKLGLEEPAKLILNNPCRLQISSYVQYGKEGLSTSADVNKGIQHIVADIISKDKDTRDKMKAMCNSGKVTIESTQKTRGKVDNTDMALKFEQYYNFKAFIKTVKSHQILAINRGENLNILAVKVTIPDAIVLAFKRWCSGKWTPRSSDQFAKTTIETCIEDSYVRLIQPLIVRQIRSELTKKAELSAIDVFSHNLKRLLLTPPVRGKTVLGIDPGFRNGCKLAMTSSTGEILYSGTVYLHGSHRNNFEAQNIRRLLLQHSCETLAIGNGTACRETEAYFSNLIKSGHFRPLNVMYCIVDECGASIYSVSDEAKGELPNMDPNLRSAVSIAKRLQEPLNELVKIEPKHLGVGMYQHDLSTIDLKGALASVVEECVSFVGVDLNVCTESLLRRVAGISEAKAKKIIEWRNQNGPFTNREQLKTVKGLGPKTFEQCAGFVRINPNSIGITGQNRSGDETEDSEASTGRGKKRKARSTKGGSKSKKAKASTPTEVNPLDMTCIHPESYSIAEQFLEKVRATADEIGQARMKNVIERTLQQIDHTALAEELEVGVPTLQLIIDGLKQPTDYDIRAEYEKPLFRQSVMSVEDLQVGTLLTGRVCNLTNFGAFVDVGVGKNGLIHTSAMPTHRLKNGQPLGPGDKVRVRVSNLDINKGRIGLELVCVL
ncbi:S1 RNA-binding domain-containing protein 1-like [Ptychodera flava]|uniref:S1 RNA-binding domain-containing protein 1-like n=1 Tax=Ptychodera flava TaxID=63121 RepID=UPI00396A1ADC